MDQMAQQYETGKRGTFNLTRTNARIDLVLGSLLVGTGISAYVNTALHIVLGVTMLTGVVIHLVLHWRWIVATAGRLRQIPASVRRKALLVLLMLLSFVPLVLSGGVVALIYAPRVSNFHTTTFYIFVGLVLLHLILSWRWIAARVRRASSGSTRERPS